MNNLPPIKVIIKTGDEKFLGICDGQLLTLKEFWQWLASDLVSNATRGILAEYIVAAALGLNQGVRYEWNAYDLKTETGLKIEVKSAAYIQSWYQRTLSKITFGIRPTLAWDYETNRQGKEKKRQAGIYVFCLLHHKNKETINPMDLSQWTFYVISTKKLENACPEAKSITLGRLKKLNSKECRFDTLKETITAHVGWAIK
ncbi:MAG: hypothetical protein JXB29_02290 [Sedimentisphaerales bacterium]|nr:hypothetical protein [Sedimentisphaerales bacterium]